MALRQAYHPLSCSPPRSPALLADPADEAVVMVVLDRPRGVYTGQHRGRRIGDMARDSRRLRLRLRLLESNRREGPAGCGDGGAALRKD
ncbi:hypothetical protein PpBr36_08051 [Pyricularia pennisetigena]|uniref:hypothetical protein n=1 Tax=Pyricularia pennisetigena TaxID=1578925 RepID=UPI0011514F57|nr:hypothetical protein PpBr36_08051 [Pyricularia pennisetigena]TLS24847.1 hypothetical protein PpBr36_08051 [Pyricularia pennisetigena]